MCLEAVCLGGGGQRREVKIDVSTFIITAGTEPVLFTTSVDESKRDKLSTVHSVSVSVFSLC